ncbi:MAG: adenylylsulfate reductase, thioredoxin dependent family protein [Alphaproteobacteria bacterium]|nr:MAG: adenylylsulfate reductase thioredoxin dependent family protein [Caulobacteraceae bacterium]TPW08384.1 MAG: adenylylsulfate reductase, thioredoxin dependent family protein [Alphaproteobacteria bacterium]
MSLTPALAEKVRRTQAVLAEAAALGGVALASSLSAEDMVLTHLVAEAALPISVFAIDTGRLHEETVALIDAARETLGVAIEVYRPDPAAVAAYVAGNGANAFYDSLDLRKSCCHIRKVEPLERALKGKRGWITGQRREQAATRTELAEREHDAARGIEKFNPLADWSWDDVLAYAKAADVPINPLHARGYVSIGCDPCTRAIRPGEDPRAGRWWWEQSDSKECGLHVSPLPESRAGAPA